MVNLTVHVLLLRVQPSDGGHGKMVAAVIL